MDNTIHCITPVPGGLAIGGRFGQAGTVVSSIARWGTNGFEPLTSISISGIVWRVQHLDPDGPGAASEALYVAGRLGAPGLQGPVMQWTGSAWQTLGDLSSTEEARAILVHDDGSGPALYAAFAGTLRSWNGTQWTSIGGVADTFNALAEFDEDGPGPMTPKLFVGGSNVGVRRWSGAALTPVGSDLTGEVRCLVVIDLDGEGPQLPALYAGGSFAPTASIPAQGLARWDGTSWSTLGTGVAGAIGTNVPTVLAIADIDEDGQGPLPTSVVIGGSFTSVNGVAATYTARWRAGDWGPIDGPLNGAVYCLTHSGKAGAEALYAGGEFTAPGSRMARLSQGEWKPIANGLDNTVFALKVMDLGAGSKLWVGGAFGSVAGGGVQSGRVATWDGQEWNALGGGFQGESVYAFESFDDGTGAHAYAAGDFTLTGGFSASGLALLDASGYHDLGGGVTGYVRKSAVFDEDGAGPLPPSVFIGGNFSSVGGQPISHLARWDGTQWSEVGGGLSALPFAVPGVRDMVVWDDGTGPALYVAGAFTHAGGVGVYSVAKWDGAQWSSLAGGTGSASTTITSLQVFDDGTGEALFAGCTNSAVLGGTPVGRVARWDGFSWTPVGSTTWNNNARIEDLEVYDAGSGLRLYAAGRFSTINGLERRGIAVLEAGSWMPVGGGLDSGSETVNAMRVFNGSLIVGGNFSSVSGTSQWIARWDGSTWHSLGGPNGEVTSLATFDSGGGAALYVGGLFSTIPGFASPGLARWTGSAWEAPGAVGGGPAAVRGLSVATIGGTPTLVIGGEFTTAAILSANRIAKWNGTVWEPLGAGLNGIVSAMCTFNDGSGPALFVTGAFTSAGGTPANRIAKWDGATWSPLGQGLAPFGAGSLCVFDDGSGPALYVGGGFDTAGGVASRGIARWKNGQWSAVSQGISFGHKVQAMSVYTDGISSALYVGGNFVGTQPLPSSGAFLAKWTGSAWVTAPGPLNGQVNALTTLIDANGAQLYAAGAFTTAGGVNVNGIARWDGQAWSALSTGTLGINTLAAYQDQVSPALFAGGGFLTAGGVSSERLARWGCGLGDQLPNCAVNCDGSTGQPILNVNDFVCFLNRYSQGSAYANCDQSTTVPILNVNDFVCFLNKFSLGCN